MVHLQPPFPVDLNKHHKTNKTLSANLSRHISSSESSILFAYFIVSSFDQLGVSPMGPVVCFHRGPKDRLHCEGKRQLGLYLACTSGLFHKFGLAQPLF
jgi:hypothetical protein